MIRGARFRFGGVLAAILVAASFGEGVADPADGAVSHPHTIAIRAVQVHHGVARFKLRGVAPTRIRSARLSGPRHRGLSVRKVRAAARRGVLRLRVASRKAAWSTRRARRHKLVLAMKDPAEGRRKKSGGNSTTTGGAGGTGSTGTTAPAGPPGQSWRTVFSDDFNDQLDTAVWHTCFWWSSTTCSIPQNNELQLYNPDDAFTSNGVLPPDGSTPFPSYLDVDYVRVWQRG